MEFELPISTHGGKLILLYFTICILVQKRNQNKPGATISTCRNITLYHDIDIFSLDLDFTYSYFN